MSALTDRTFGIEIECGGPQDALIANIRRRVGFTPHVHGDGSGNEIHTGILKGEKGIIRLKRMMDAIREAGGWTSRSDGMHVHHGAKEFYQNPELQHRLVMNFLRMEEAIESIIAPYRRGNYGSCRRQYVKPGTRIRSADPWDEVRVCPTKWTDFSIPSGRGKLNLSNLRSETGKHTVELRMHEGTLHSASAEAWVRMGQALIERTVESKRLVRTCSTVRGLSTNLGLEVEVAEVLQEKAKSVRDPESVSIMRRLMSGVNGNPVVPAY